MAVDIARQLTLALALLAGCEPSPRDVEMAPVTDAVALEDVDGVRIDDADGPSDSDDLNFIPISCDGKPMWDIFKKEEERTGPIRMGCGPRWGRMRPELVHNFLQADETVAAVNGCGARASIAQRVFVRFVVGRDGRVGRVAATPHGTLAICVEKIVRKATFPPPDGGPVHVNVPIDVAPAF